MNDRPNMSSLSRKHIVQGCEASLKRLGIETIDLYQIHRFDPVTPMEETLAGADLPDEAWLRSIATFGELNVRQSPAGSSSPNGARVVAVLLFGPPL